MQAPRLAKANDQNPSDGLEKGKTSTSGLNLGSLDGFIIPSRGRG